jgi:hypothetical protein
MVKLHYTPVISSIFLLIPGNQTLLLNNSGKKFVVVMFIISNMQTQGVIFLFIARVSGKYETDDNNSFPMYLSSLFFFF